MPRITKAERMSLWLDRLDRFAKSGQSVAEFCLDEGISQPSFYHWKRRLSPKASQPEPQPDKSRCNHKPSNSKSKFTEIAVASPPMKATQIRLPHGVVIELGSEQVTVANVIEQVLARCVTTEPTKETPC